MQTKAPVVFVIALLMSTSFVVTGEALAAPDTPDQNDDGAPAAAAPSEDDDGASAPTPLSEDAESAPAADDATADDNAAHDNSGAAAPTPPVDADDDDGDDANDDTEVSDNGASAPTPLTHNDSDKNNERDDGASAPAAPSADDGEETGHVPLVKEAIGPAVPPNELEVAAEPDPNVGPLRLTYRSVNGARFNPLGLISSNTVGLRYRLYESDNPLLQNNFVGVSLLPTLSGGFGRFGALAELQPLSVMRVWARFETFAYWGIFNLFQSFEDASSDFSDTKQRELGSLDAADPRKNYPTWGTQLTLGMDLLMKLGPVVGRSFSRLVRSDFNMRDGDTVFYEQLYDVLAPNHGFYFHNDTDLLGYLDLSFLDLFDGMRVVGGLRNSVTVPVYTDAHFAHDNADRTSDNPVRRTFGDNLPIWRIGPLISFTLYDHPTWVFNQPTVFVGTQWHVVHRWRTGADVSIFVPYTFFGFSFTGDLLTAG